MQNNIFPTSSSSSISESIESNISGQEIKKVRPVKPFAVESFSFCFLEFQEKKTFENNDMLETEEEIVELKEDGSPDPAISNYYRCHYDKCIRKFKYKWLLEKHYLLHDRIFKCCYVGCSKQYKTKENLILHIKNYHLGEKPFKCKFCDEKFSHRNGKLYHERKTHLNILPHKCPRENCENAYASKSALKYHLNNQHDKNVE